MIFMANLMMKIETNPVKVAYLNHIMIDSYTKAIKQMEKDNKHIVNLFTDKQLEQYLLLCSSAIKLSDLKDE